MLCPPIPQSTLDAMARRRGTSPGGDVTQTPMDDAMKEAVAELRQLMQ